MQQADWSRVWNPECVAAYNGSLQATPPLERPPPDAGVRKRSAGLE